MNPRDLPDLAHLAAVVRNGSFTRAAAELGVSRSALSHSVASLEDRLGLRLLNRTTRSVSLTPAGARLLSRLDPALDEIAQAVDEVNSFRERPSGCVRLNVPRLAALLFLGPALPVFLAQHPDVQVEMAVEDATVDIVAKGFDAGVRFGERLADDMVAVPIGPPVEFAVVGSTAYFASRPVPNSPADLRAHTCIRYRMKGSGALFDWEFQRGGRRLSVAVDGPMTLDAPEFMVRAALDGAGLAYTALQDVSAAIQDGRLIRVLRDWSPAIDRMYLYYPSRKHVPAAFRALVDHLLSYAEVTAMSTGGVVDGDRSVR
jgi:DNA-binding transcriptional LysR family regulator